MPKIHTSLELVYKASYILIFVFSNFFNNYYFGDDGLIFSQGDEAQSF